jgi:hypothetical protein
MQTTPLENLTLTLMDSIQLEIIKKQLERDQKRVEENLAKLKAIRDKYNEENQMLFI